MARFLKNGKIAVKLAPDTMAIIRQAIQIRIELDELPDFLQYLLGEASDKLEGDKCSFRKSEFFAVFHNDTMQYIDIPTQMLIREAVQLVGNNAICLIWPLMKMETSAPLFHPISEDENIEI